MSAPKTSYAPHQPDIQVERPGVEETLRVSATKAANAMVDSYVSKMVDKVAKCTVGAYVVIKSVEVNGVVWDGARMNVVTDAGDTQRWNTKCILNRSGLGTIFNQWPTRLAK